MDPTDVLFTICQAVFVASTLPVIFVKKKRMPRVVVLSFCFGYCLLTLTAINAGLIMGSVLTSLGFLANAYIAVVKSD